MTRREFIPASAAAMALLGPNPARGAETRRPDVLVVVGNWNVRRWMAQGTAFTRCYAACPELGLARAAMLTGRYLPAKESGPPLATLVENPETVRWTDDTLLILTAEHRGATGGEPLDACARVPLVIRYPRLFRPGTIDEALISHADLLPTVLARCGVAVLPDMQGHGLAPEERPDSIFAYGRRGTPQEWRMIVRGYEKLVVNAKMEATHLYNLAEDPGESRNLAAETSAPRRRDELRARLREWMKRVGYGMDASGLKTR